MLVTRRANRPSQEWLRPAGASHADCCPSIIYRVYGGLELTGPVLYVHTQVKERKGRKRERKEEGKRGLEGVEKREGKGRKGGEGRDVR